MSSYSRKMYLHLRWRICAAGLAAFCMTALLHSSPSGTEGCFPICNLIRMSTPAGSTRTRTPAGSPQGTHWHRPLATRSRTQSQLCLLIFNAVAANAAPRRLHPCQAHSSQGADSRLGDQLTNLVKNLPAQCISRRRVMSRACEMSEWASLPGSSIFNEALSTWGNGWNHLLRWTDLLSGLQKSRLWVAPRGHGKAPSRKQREPAPDTESVGVLILDFPSSKTQMPSSSTKPLTWEAVWRREQSFPWQRTSPGK
nr:uncharacterized protein LOC129054939 isoform X2 [Pongo abelii]